MRVLHICNVYPPYPHGGVGSTVADLAPHLARALDSYTIAGHYHRKFLAENQCHKVDEASPFPIHRFPNPFPARPHRITQRLSRLHFRWCLEGLWRRSPWDVLISQDYEGPLPYGAPGNAPQIAMLHGSNFVYDDIMNRCGDRLIHRFEKSTLRHATMWCGVSNFILEATSKRLAPAPLTKLGVTYNGLDCAGFARPPAAIPVPGRIIFHNSLRPRKGILDLMDAMPSVVACVPHAELHVYGSCRDFEEFRRTLYQRMPESCRSRVHIHGWIPRDQLPAQLHQAQVACYPSHLETFGLAPVEAMAAGCVTIYTDTGPGPEIMEHGVSGLLCQPANPQSLANTLITALRMTEAERAAMAGAATERATSRFDRAVVAAAYMDLFKSMVRQPGSALGN